MKIQDTRVKSYHPLIPPADIRSKISISKKSKKTIYQGRREIENILSKSDHRLLIITGPCSIHDDKAAIEYAEKLRDLKKRVAKNVCLVMRVYFEKPRTTIGWKGLINDPNLDGSYDVNNGLKIARRLLLKIAEMEIYTATEFLDPIIPQFISDLICWAAIGARTTESQTHREMASGLSMPVGFKNSTKGCLDVAINAMLASKSAQNFLGINKNGQACAIKTAGNQFCHLVLRGGEKPNHYEENISEAQKLLRNNRLNDSVIVDCSHGNSNKNYKKQSDVFREVISQRLGGNSGIVGVMLESNLCEGAQKYNGEPLKYGISITDACIGWQETEKLILNIKT